MQISLFQLSYMALWLVAILLLPISLSILYRVAALYEHISELSVPKGAILGTPIPGTTALDLRSDDVQTEEQWKTGSRVFLVVSAKCSSCKSILQDMATRADYHRKTRLSILCVSSIGRCQTMLMTIRGASIPILKPNDWPEQTEMAVGGLPAILVLDEEQKIRDIRRPTSAHDLMSFLTLLESEAQESKRGADSTDFSIPIRQSIVE